MKNSYFEQEKFIEWALEMDNKLDVLEKVNELYEEGIMDKNIKYEEEKRKIKARNLPPLAYEKAIKALAKKLGI